MRRQVKCSIHELPFFQEWSTDFNLTAQASGSKSQIREWASKIATSEELAFAGAGFHHTLFLLAQTVTLPFALFFETCHCLGAC
jgi:hypothetical protein